MVKLKIDVSESDPVEAAAAGNFEAIKPGLYLFKISEVNAGFSKGDDGKPNANKPRIEVVFKCEDARHKGAQVWGYFILKGHPDYDKKAAQKLDQLLLAVKFTDGKKNRIADLDTDKHLVGKLVVVRVRAGTTQSGEPRGEFGSVFPPETPTGATADTKAADDGDMIDGDDDVMADDDAITEDGEATDWDARYAELTGADIPALKDIAKAYDIKISGKKKAEVVDALIEFEKALEAETGDEIAPDDDVIADDDDDIILDDDDVAGGVEYLTREGLAAMETPEIARIAKEDFDLVIKGKKKSEVIDMILEAQAAPADVDPNKPPF